MKSPFIREYAELTDEQKRYNRDFVREIPRILAMADYTITCTTTRSHRRMADSGRRPPSSRLPVPSDATRLLTRSLVYLVPGRPVPQLYDRQGEFVSAEVWISAHQVARITDIGEKRALE